MQGEISFQVHTMCKDVASSINFGGQRWQYINYVYNKDHVFAFLSCAICRHILNIKYNNL